MSDSLFTVSPSQGLTNRLARVEGAIPYIRRATQVFSSSSVKAPSSSAVNPVANSAISSGTINPATGIANVGNASPFAVNGSFGFAATPSSITLYWDGTHGSKIFSIKRGDGTSFTIPVGQMTVGGLQAKTTYGFLAYNRLSSPGQLSFTIGDVGSPQFAFSPNASSNLIATANQNQQLASNEAITNSFVYFTTPAGGTNAGVATPGILPAYPGASNRPL